MDGSKPQHGGIAAVLGYRHDGLGARLMAMGNGLRVAAKVGCPFGFVWTTDPDLANIAEPSALFDIAAMAKADVPFMSIVDAFVLPVDSRLIFATGNLSTLDIAAVPAGSTLLTTCAATLLLQDEAVIVARNGLSKAMKKIVPTPQIVERSEAFMNRHDLPTAIGVHVRRGDIVRPDYPRRDQRVVALDQYFAMLDLNRTRDEQIFLCTEDRSVIDAFEVRYPNRVLRYPTRSWDRADRGAVEDALVEIIALGRTSFVIGGPSCFSRAATGLGLNPLVAIVNTVAGDARNFMSAAVEFIRFGMLDRAASNLAACESAPESDVLVALRKRFDLALGASQARAVRNAKPAPGTT
jgi:hypothetical protein